MAATRISYHNRDHDELRYSLRSVLSNFRPYLDRLHVLTSDFAIPNTVENVTWPLDHRLGQVPQWLHVDKRPWADGSVKLSIKHHAEIFHPYDDNVFNRWVRLCCSFPVMLMML